MKLIPEILQPFIETIKLNQSYINFQPAVASVVEENIPQ